MPNLCLGFLPIDKQLQKLRAHISLSGHVGYCPRLGVILHLKQKNGGHEDDIKSLWRRSTITMTFYEKQTVRAWGQADSEEGQTGQSTAGYSCQVPCLEKI